MVTGKETTKKVKEMLNDARDTGRYLYMGPLLSANDSTPIRIIGVSTVRGTTIAKTMYGTIPVSDWNINRLYVG